MTLRHLKVYGPPGKLPMRTTLGGAERKRLLHIGLHNSVNRNAGDTLLFPVVRQVFDAILGPFEWELRQAWEELTIEEAHRIGKEFDGIVLGGGGLLLRDQAGSDASSSGWQWNSSIAAVEALETPLVIFAIGYNRFRGQPDFDPVFTDHIRAVASKAGFFGLRNSGSIKALSAYLTTALARTLRRQYCPTNVLWQLFPAYQKLARQHDSEGARILAFNAAFDRTDHRFGKQAGGVLSNVARAVKGAQDRGWKIVVVAHKTIDRGIEPYLDAAEVFYDAVDLTDASPEEIMSFYAKVDFAFGMRGHAQMIPFGLRRPIMSIVSHDKMRFLLEDINRLHWGVEVDAKNLPDRLAEALNRVECAKATVHADIASAQEGVWRETMGNMIEIGGSLLQLEPRAEAMKMSG